MLMQEEEQNLSFSLTGTPVPRNFVFAWPGMRLQFSVREKDLPQLIPALTTVPTDLQIVREGKHEIVGITYDEQNKKFIIEHKESGKKKRDEGIAVGEWSYVKGVGFFAKEGESLLDQAEITEEKIADFLDSNAKTLQSYLKNSKIFPEEHTLHFDLHFDKKWNLNISSYLFKKGDLAAAGTTSFDNWIFLPSSGFYRISGQFFEDLFQIIPKNAVSHFVNENRIWLGGQEGFRTFLAPAETPLTYEVSKEGILSFIPEKGSEDSAESNDFGDWIYVPSQGFFSKRHARTRGVLHPHTKIPKEEVAAFIRSNREELELMPHFFTTLDCIKRRALSIKVLSENTIVTEPITIPYPDYAGEKFLFFEEFAYIVNRGFSELSSEQRLPKEYEHKKVIKQDDFDRFINEELPRLTRYAEHIDPGLKKPHQCELIVDYLVRTSSGMLKGSFVYATEFGRISADEISQAIAKKKHYLFSEAGLIDLRSDRFRWLRHLTGTPSPDQTIELSTMAFLRLEAQEPLLITNEETPSSSITRRIIQELRDFTIIEPFNLRGLKSELRLYFFPTYWS